MSGTILLSSSGSTVGRKGKDVATPFLNFLIGEFPIGLPCRFFGNLGSSNFELILFHLIQLSFSKTKSLIKAAHFSFSPIFSLRLHLEMKNIILQMTSAQLLYS